MPPLPWSIVPGSKKLPPVGRIPQALSKTESLSLHWRNEKTDWATNYFTGIEASIDLQNWVEIGRFPFEPETTFTLTNTEAFGFYRVYNGINQ